MSVVAEPRTALWPPGFRIRPAAGDEAHRIEIADAISRRRFRWPPLALAREILEADDGSDGKPSKLRELKAAVDDRSELVPGWRHWHQRGWHPSDELYVASRQCWPFVDVNDDDGSIRTATVERFLAHDGPPLEAEHADGPVIELPPPAPPAARPVSELLVKRRSERAYKRTAVPLETLSGFLWHALEGIRVRRRRESVDNPLSYLDSYGAAWDVYLCLYGVDGLEPGAYAYDLVRHELVCVRPGDHRQAMAQVLQGMRAPVTAAWTLGLVADFPRYAWRYRHEYGLRKLYLEAGFIAQELIVVGMSYGLGTVVTPAQQDTLYLELHRLSRERYAPVHTLTMGPSRRRWAAQEEPKR
jgi:SagB-type dehydrogenase family enzyme